MIADRCASARSGLDGDPMLHGAPVAREGDETPQECLALGPLLRRQRRVQVFGRPCDRSADAADRLVRLDREHGALALPPGLGERVREVGEHAGFARRVAEDEFGQAVFDSQARESGGFLDRQAEGLGGSAGARTTSPALDERTEPGIGDAAVEGVRAQREDDIVTRRRRCRRPPRSTRRCRAAIQSELEEPPRTGR